MNIMNFITKIDEKVKQFTTWFETLSYEKQFGIILVLIFIGIPTSIITTLILPIIAAFALILAIKFFRYGKKENDLFFLVPVVMLSFIGGLLLFGWVSIFV